MQQTRTVICDSVFMTRGCENLWKLLKNYSSLWWQLCDPKRSFQSNGRVRGGWTNIDDMLRLMIRLISITETTEESAFIKLHVKWACPGRIDARMAWGPTEHFVLTKCINKQGHYKEIRHVSIVCLFFQMYSYFFYLTSYTCVCVLFAHVNIVSLPKLHWQIWWHRFRYCF